MEVLLPGVSCRCTQASSAQSEMPATTNPAVPMAQLNRREVGSEKVSAVR